LIFRSPSGKITVVCFYLMKLPRVTIGLVLFGQPEMLIHSLPSLVAQDYHDLEFLFRDHSENGAISKFIEEKLPEVFVRVKLEQGENLMHSGGHNALIAQMTGDYYLCCSYDMIYDADVVKKLVAALEKSPKFGSATCKIRRADFASEQEKKTNILDSMGLGITKAHHFFEIGNGEKDEGQFDSMKEVFGGSGALVMLRKAALEEVAEFSAAGEKDYFDPIMHYKNDVDLAYRFQWAGWKSLVVPSAVVYHQRQASSGGGEKSQMADILESRIGKSEWVKSNSYFGQMVILRKNFTGQPFSIGVKLQTWWRRFLQISFILVFERYITQQLKTLWQVWPEVKRKSQAMPRKVKAREIEQLMK